MDVITFPVNLYTTSGLQILLHGVISLPDATAYDNWFYHMTSRASGRKKMPCIKISKPLASLVIYYQSRSSVYIRGLILRNSTELAEAVPIGVCAVILRPTTSYKLAELIF